MLCSLWNYFYCLLHSTAGNTEAQCKQPLYIGFRGAVAGEHTSQLVQVVTAPFSRESAYCLRNA
jgi:hypothetical protein